ncbi:hypothetical protein D3C87_1833860 [compost metagenome]
MAVGIGDLTEQGYAVFRDHRHFRAADRCAAVNRLDKYIARFVLGAFGDDAQIGYYHKT